MNYSEEESMWWDENSNEEDILLIYDILQSELSGVEWTVHNRIIRGNKGDVFSRSLKTQFSLINRRETQEKSYFFLPANSIFYSERR